MYIIYGVLYDFVTLLYVDATIEQVYVNYGQGSGSDGVRCNTNPDAIYDGREIGLMPVGEYCGEFWVEVAKEVDDTNK